MKSGKRFISDFHDHLIAIFNTKDPKRKSDESIVDTLVKEAAEQAKTDQFLKFQGDLKGKERDQCNSPLQFLLAKGGENQKILHRVFDPESPICRSDDEGDDRDGEVDVPRIEADGPTSLTKANTPKTKVDDPASKQPFGHLTAFVEFLVRLQPELLVALDKEKRTPLFSAIILEGIDISAKERMLRYFCENTGPKPFDETIVEKARKSLTIMGKYRFDDDDDDDDEYNALHLAIMKDVYIGERTVDGLKKMFASVKNKRGRREQTPCLQIPGANGDTPLHMALSVGGNHTWSDAKISWAKTLAKLEPRLLGVGRTVPDGAGATQKLTPLQLFTEQLSKRSLNKKGRDQSTKALGADLEQELESLRDYLKLQCLKVYTDDSEAKDIMYPDNDSEHQLTVCALSSSC
ncbi:hypothetical protein N656DRAFT_742628 [Canariomyces notabilis]|uniref:Ankyrin repeat protein n=1 Tax=Canariomyces notabilis TaxID=2074819 RepID=A0AAN6T7E6_9PEZI|nr:hypothetical protein N656DRAFT_742628 [Canariomyces arenarius]